MHTYTQIHATILLAVNNVIDKEVAKLSWSNTSCSDCDQRSRCNEVSIKL